MLLIGQGILYYYIEYHDPSIKNGSLTLGVINTTVCFVNEKETRWGGLSQLFQVRNIKNKPPPKVCPCWDLTGSGRDLAWFSGV